MVWQRRGPARAAEAAQPLIGLMTISVAWVKSSCFPRPPGKHA
jgi:hypothetical protein